MSKRRTWAQREQRKSIIAMQDYQRAAEERKRRLYNRIYHKSLIYRICYAARLIFLLFFFWLFIYEGGVTRLAKEKVTDVGYWETDRNKANWQEFLHFSTHENNYEALMEWRSYPYVKPGDTILVHYNYFNKAFSFKILKEVEWHPFYMNWVFMGLIAFLVILSLFYRDGLDTATHKLILSAAVAGLIGFLYYVLIV